MPALLVAVDGSSETEQVVATAVAFSAGRDLVIFHARADGATPRGPAIPEEQADEADAVVSAAAASARGHGAGTVSTRVDRVIAGQEARAILDAAADVHADAVVMGHRGAGALVGLVVGSVAYKVLHLSQIPVLIAR